MRLGESLGVRRDDAGEAVQRQRTGVLLSSGLRSGRRGLRVVASVARVAPEHEGEETDDSDGDPEQHDGRLEERPGIALRLVIGIGWVRSHVFS